MDRSADAVAEPEIFEPSRRQRRDAFAAADGLTLFDKKTGVPAGTIAGASRVKPTLVEKVSINANAGNPYACVTCGGVEYKLFATPGLTYEGVPEFKYGKGEAAINLLTEACARKWRVRFRFAESIPAFGAERERLIIADSVRVMEEPPSPQASSTRIFESQTLAEIRDSYRKQLGPPAAELRPEQPPARLSPKPSPVGPPIAKKPAKLRDFGEEGE